MSGEDRASRLRNRRKRAKDKATGSDEAAEPDERTEPDETTETSQSAESSKPSEPSKPLQSDEPPETGGPSETDELGEERSVKDEQVGTYMYLPREQKKELERTYNLLKAEYEFEFDEEFEKNRHFFPLVVRHGLDELAAADAGDVPDLLEDV